MKVDVSLDLYRIFCTVVRTGNMSAAARELFISQPAVSMAIRQLEDRMGSPLLVRTAKGVYPTAEGKLLYTYLEQALGLIHAAEEKYFQMVNMEMGELKIGASDTVIANFLLPYLEKYHKLYPDINIKVTNKTTYESLRLLKNGSVDVCFINLPISDDGDLEITPCIEIHDVLVGGERYKLLSQVGLELKDLPEYPLLLLEDLSNSRRYIDRYAEENGVVLTPILELGSSDLLISFAQINLGLTYVIKEFTQEALKEKHLYEVPVDPPLPKRNIGMVRLKNVAAPHAVKGFIELIEFQENI
ncbi:LysR family transcriptional regulator [Anaerotignum sp. MB30-C6]|uniref:LysR family transcriptional regulator n=1 Tax=Anaerotignum sp. MB30-C6 TaxID=3070814 RepID=UPI0027DDC670|nr:LysR family transcriptional regulator [Anaerotignum sp. MB30-C6]WMI81486.1 LysR family transcriptional regulator [Anaerotignum sp. MB30-C6]